MLYVVALAWMYVVVMVALVEVFSPQGSALGALFTVIGWGVIPLSVVLYILATPARRAARRAEASAANPDCGSHAAGDVVAPEGKKP